MKIPFALPLGRSEFWIALALVTSSMTSFRLAAFPIGFSEILIASIFIVQIYLFRIKLLSSPIHIFWLLAIPILAIGYLSQVFSGVAWLHESTTDFAALIFAMFSSFVFVNLTKRLNFYIFIVYFSRLSVVFFLTIIAYSFLFQFDSLSGTRLTGFSHNPNQLALFCLVSLVVYAFIPHKAGKSKKFTVLRYGSGFLALSVGFLSGSDAFFIAVLTYFTIIFIARIFNLNSQNYLFAFAKLFFIISLLVFVVYFFFNIEFFIDQVLKLIEDGDQGSIRFTLWENGLKAISYSPIFGWGPGAWSGLGAPLEGAEAHNTYIDWGTKSGLLGLLALLLLQFAAIKSAIKGGNIILFALVCALFVFSFFHLVIRQPGYWFILTLCFGSAWWARLTTFKE